jgi:hypothetical protein
MHFDEARIFQWRIEHKLIQALVLNHYCDGSIPPTRGLSRELAAVIPELRLNTLERLCADGFMIKATLGYGSGEKKIIHRAPMVLDELNASNGFQVPDSLCDETFVLQKKIEIEQEYRVHSLEGRVIPSLTFFRYRPDIVPSDRDGPNSYVQDLIGRLPSGFLSGAMYGWDVAYTSGRFMVIELNPVGLSPVFEPGFHCSGFFLDSSWGPPVTAKFLRFVEEEYDTKIKIDVDVLGDGEEFQVYLWVARWKELLDAADAVQSLVQRFEQSERVALSEWANRTESGGQNSFVWALGEVYRPCKVLQDFYIPSPK